MKAINCKDLFVEETFICQIKAVRDYFIEPLSGRESEGILQHVKTYLFIFITGKGWVSMWCLYIFLQELKACIRKSFRECEIILK